MMWLANIFNHTWSTEQIPDDWRKGIILPFWKRKGDALTCSINRGITLLSIPGKTFARVVINRAIPAMHHHRRPHQAGFMPGLSTTDHISAIRFLAEKAREFRKYRTLFIDFLDIKAAFDCVWDLVPLTDQFVGLSFDDAVGSAFPMTCLSDVQRACLVANVEHLCKEHEEFDILPVELLRHY